MGILEEEKEKETESLFKEIMDENFPNLEKKWTSRFMKLKRNQIGWIQKSIHQTYHLSFMVTTKENL